MKTYYINTSNPVRQTFLKTNLIHLALMTLCISLFTISVQAAESVKKNKKGYTEEEFIVAFSGKQKAVALQYLGDPVKKEQSIKPMGANEMMAVRGREASKPISVEMWYYSNVVTYAPKKYYKSTEMTFVDGKCTNIAFFNTK